MFFVLAGLFIIGFALFIGFSAATESGAGFLGGLFVGLGGVMAIGSFIVIVPAGIFVFLGSLSPIKQPSTSSFFGYCFAVLAAGVVLLAFGLFLGELKQKRAAKRAPR